MTQSIPLAALSGRVPNTDNSNQGSDETERGKNIFSCSQNEGHLVKLWSIRVMLDKSLRIHEMGLVDSPI